MNNGNTETLLVYQCVTQGVLNGNVIGENWIKPFSGFFKRNIDINVALKYNQSEYISLHNRKRWLVLMLFC